MPAYHSSFNDEASIGASVGGCRVLPLRDGPRGPAAIEPALAERGEGFDIVDEAIEFYRANVLFKTFEVKGDADRTLIYLTLFVQLLVTTASTIPAKADATRTLNGLGTAPRFTIPGEAGFPAQSMYPPMPAAGDAERLRQYLRQAREATVQRLLPRLYNEDGSPNKHWMAFAKKKFMGLEIRS